MFWNYGDAISVFLIDELIYDFFPYSAQTHVIGSVIFDGILQNYDESNSLWKKQLYDDRDVKAVFWGCGIRSPGSLNSDLYPSVEILAVRGPVSASDLRLGETVPQGDPALLLPALYKPRRSSKFFNKSICVPHYNDNRTDEEIRKISGCDLILRSAVKKDKDSIKAFINAICSARFILAGAMHAAITAAAYGIPFAFWDSGTIDIPTKWEDTASLLGIRCVYFGELTAAVDFYEREIAPAITIPPLWPLICVAPGFLKMGGMLKVLKYELERSTGAKHEELDYFIDEIIARNAHHSHLAVLAKDMHDQFVEQNKNLSENLSSTQTLLKTRDEELSSVRAAYDGIVIAQAGRSEELTAIFGDKSALEQQLAAQSALLDQALADQQTAMQDRGSAQDRLFREIAEKDRALSEHVELTARQLEGMRTVHDRDIAQEKRDGQRLQEEVAQLRGKISMLQKKGEEEEARGLTERAAFEEQIKAIAQRLHAAHEQTRHQQDLQNASEKQIEDLAAQNEKLEETSVELASERSQFKRLADEYGTKIEAFSLEVSELSTEIEDQRLRFDRRVQNLSMEHEEQILAQKENYRSFEEVIGRLQEKMMSQLAKGEANAQQAQAQFETTRRSLENDIARLQQEREATDARNADLNREIARLEKRLVAEDSEARSRSLQIEQLHKEIHQVRSQADSLRDQTHGLVIQQRALRDNLALRESEDAARAADANTAITRYWHLTSQTNVQMKSRFLLSQTIKNNKKAKILHKNCAMIDTFLEKFSEAELGFSRSGREQRITQYLLGVTDEIEDFPIINRELYFYLNPDVAEANIDPFIHFINNGQWEQRIIHPAINIPYYILQYPEVDKFTISPLEHFFKFGVAKNYNPSPYFSTKWYFDHYVDVKLININPVIHYLRHPGCNPNPEFDSDFYRKNNLDVVRNGMNPLVHYILWGRAEGRRPTYAAPAALAPSTAPPPTGVPLAIIEPATPKSPLAVPEQAHVAPFSSAEGRPILVMMDAFYPRPDEDSGSLDQVNFIRIFQNLGYDVHFIALLNFGDAPEVGNRVAQLGAYCITSSEFISIEEYLFLHQDQISVLFLSRVHFGGAWIERARTFCSKARILFNTVDLHHIREEREAALHGDADGVARARETKRLEYACINMADASIVVSDYEQKLLADELPSARVAVVPLMREIVRSRFRGWDGRRNLAFIGGFQHQPNIDAVNYFLDDIWPIVRAQRPDLKFYVIGSHLPETLSTRSDTHVEWIGYVPEIEPWLDQLRLTVAPLRYGAGAKGKVVSSLLNGVPCVVTLVAAEGMGLRIGEDIVACPTPQEFADAIIKIHDDAETWSRLSEQGFTTISKTYSIEYAQNRVESILQFKR
ncbi:glycosyltransferase [Methylobacterium sp. BTF04]|uniref:glycosyltransferase n=1 Tax=Methylobacterium sp. BTF04 TaxID=2708300 RepID=UPI0013D56143|nr:glycosyltransferase [Methylobacterium sp. BTF04]NEU14580.1 glycosyltransferase [Methylobacterium sp. BTF04]